MTETERVNDKTLRAWLNAGPVHRGIGGGLTFVGTRAGALKCQASWILCYRFGGTTREKVLGRYPDLSLILFRGFRKQSLVTSVSSCVSWLLSSIRSVRNGEWHPGDTPVACAHPSSAGGRGG